MKTQTLHYIARRGEPVYYSGASAYHGDRIGEPFHITCIDADGPGGKAWAWIAQSGGPGQYVAAEQLTRPAPPERMPRERTQGRRG